MSKLPKFMNKVETIVLLLMAVPVFGYIGAAIMSNIDLLMYDPARIASNPATNPFAVFEGMPQLFTTIGGLLGAIGGAIGVALFAWNNH